MSRKPSKSQLAQENISRLASIGLAAMESETARRQAYAALKAIRQSRFDPVVEVKPGEYIQAARERKNSRERMLRMIARYRKWLEEVNDVN